MKDKIKEKVQAFSTKHNCPVTWRDLRFGYRRAEFCFSDYQSYEKARSAAGRLRNVHTESFCHHVGQFEGWLYLMDSADYADLMASLTDEQVRVEAWWQRYHSADPETRRLMACGRIA